MRSLRVVLPGRRRVPAVLMILGCLVLGGCKVSARVAISMRSDGRGLVRVRVVADPDAVATVEAGGGTLEHRVRTEDLSSAGWTVSKWSRAKNGSASVEVSKPFNRPDELAAIIREVSGADGPLGVFRAERSSGLISTSYRIRGTVDLRASTVGVKSDADLIAKLTAEKVDIEQLDRTLSKQWRDAFRLTVTAELPDGTVRSVSPKPGRTVALDLSTTNRHLGKVVFLALGVLLGLVALALVTAGEFLGGPGPRARRSGSRARRSGRRTRRSGW